MLDDFFALLRAGLGIEETAISGAHDWEELLKTARRQAVLGVMFAGAKKLPPELYPPRETLMRWMSAVMRIRQANRRLTAKCAEVTETLCRAGYDSVVLKGQGVARYYPDPDLRQCGDIDIFTRPSDAGAGSPDGYVRRMMDAINALDMGRVHTPNYHHVEWDLPDASVEVHYRLSYFNTPQYDRRLWRWTLANIGEAREIDGFRCPSDTFNAVYLMVHLYRHVLIEGIGLRQVMDYAMMLNHADFTEEQRHKIIGAFKDLGMTRFARGMMWVVQHIFHIPDGKLVLEPDVDEGRFLLSEILRAGNFGQHDDRIDHELARRSVVGRFWVRTKHRARFLRHYTTEVLWDIPFRLYHWCWRKRHRV